METTYTTSLKNEFYKNIKRVEKNGHHSVVNAINKAFDICVEGWREKPKWKYYRKGKRYSFLKKHYMNENNLFLLKELLEVVSYVIYTSTDEETVWSCNCFYKDISEVIAQCENNQNKERTELIRSFFIRF